MIDIELIKLIGSLCAIGWVLFKVSVYFVSWYTNYVRKTQRNEWQAEFFDLQEKRFEWIVKEIVQINRKLKD